MELFTSRAQITGGGAAARKKVGQPAYQLPGWNGLPLSCPSLHILSALPFPVPFSSSLRISVSVSVCSLPRLKKRVFQSCIFRLADKIPEKKEIHRRAANKIIQRGFKKELVRKTRNMANSNGPPNIFSFLSSDCSFVTKYRKKLIE